MSLSSIVSLNSIMSLSSTPLNADVHLFCGPQIISLIAKEASIKISVKYVDLADIFFPNLVFKFAKHNGIKNHVIELVSD